MKPCLDFFNSSLKWIVFFKKSVKTVILWENPTPIPTNQQTLFILQTSLNKSKNPATIPYQKKKKLVSKFIANNLNLVQQCVWFCLLHFLRWEKFLSYFGSFFQSTHTKYYLSSLPSHTFSLGNSLGIKIKNWFSKMLKLYVQLPAQIFNLDFKKQNMNIVHMLPKFQLVPEHVWT